MKSLAVLLVFLAAVASAPAALISMVTKANGNDSYGSAGEPFLDVVPVSGTTELRNDRTHLPIDIPAGLTGLAEMVQVSNSDKSSGGLTHAITLDGPAYLMVGIDNRQFGGGGGTEIQLTEYSWMSDTGFTGLPSAFSNTGVLIGVDENLDGSANQYFTLFEVSAPAGTYTFGAHEEGDNNMYAIFANDRSVIPEPSVGALAGLASLLLVGRRRRA